MLIKGVDLDKYCAAFSEGTIGAFIQFLDVFDCCRNLRKYLKERRESGLVEAAEVSVEQSKDCISVFSGFKKIIERAATRTEHERAIADAEPPPPRTVIGVCKRCEGTLVGEPAPPCETAESKRVYYKECRRCTYYSEVFKIGKNNYKEVEGG